MVTQQERPMSQAERRLPVSPTIIALVIAGAILHTKADTLQDSPVHPDVAEGDRLAHTLCTNCHVVETHSPVIRTDRVPSFSWIANQEGLTSTSLQIWLSKSHERMPDLNLTRDEIREVSAYILSLRRK
jgi:mono/diheme cytochrome c family protein